MTFQIKEDKKAQIKAPDTNTKRTKGKENNNEKLTIRKKQQSLNDAPKNWDSGHTL